MDAQKIANFLQKSAENLQKIFKKNAKKIINATFLEIVSRLKSAKKLQKSCKKAAKICKKSAKNLHISNRENDFSLFFLKILKNACTTKKLHFFEPSFESSV